MALQSRALPVLITRPEPQAARFSKAVLARYGTLVEPIACPLLTPVFLPVENHSGHYGALILTSETGAIAAGRMAEGGALLPRLAFCVGNRTAKVAQDLGFDTHSAAADAEALVNLILEHQQAGPFLHLHGRETRGDIVGRLRAEGLLAVGLEVYVQEPRGLTDEVRVLLAQQGEIVAPLFSPRTAMLFAKALEDTAVFARITCIALSLAVAQEVNLKKFEVRIAMQPTQESLLDAMDKVIFQT
jgi:uroporphyrinogen-III synthase